MKKLLIMLMLIVSFAFADVKSDFTYEVEQKGCEVTAWIQDDFESGATSYMELAPMIRFTSNCLPSALMITARSAPSNKE